MAVHTLQCTNFQGGICVPLKSFIFPIIIFQIYSNFVKLGMIIDILTTNLTFMHYTTKVPKGHVVLKKNSKGKSLSRIVNPFSRIIN